MYCNPGTYYSPVLLIVAVSCSRVRFLAGGEWDVEGYLYLLATADNLTHSKQKGYCINCLPVHFSHESLSQHQRSWTMKYMPVYACSQILAVYMHIIITCI